MVAASSGLGHMILFAQQMSRTDKVIVGILVIGCIGYLTDRLFGFVIKKLLKGAYGNGWN
jgi:sulfonate transport system permease protein